MENIDEIQIKCPSKLSFKSHADLMDDIIRISKEHDVDMKLLKKSKKDLTITWRVSYQFPDQQAQAIIANMALLSAHSVVPGEVVYQKRIQSCEEQLVKFRAILDKVTLKPETA
jgi:hypothetical protein